MRGISKPNTDLALVFGGGDKAAPAGPSMKDALSEAKGGMGDDEMAEGEEDTPPPEFDVNIREAFPDLGDDQVAALYRAIQSCY